MVWAEVVGRRQWLEVVVRSLATVQSPPLAEAPMEAGIRLSTTGGPVVVQIGLLPSLLVYPP